jgi:hypothetical protein
VLYRRNQRAAGRMITSFMMHSRKNYNLGMKAIVFLKRVNHIVYGMNEFLSRKQDYRTCLSMLWDKYYDAITSGFEEAYVYRQTEVTILENDKEYYIKMKRAIARNKKKDKKSFHGIVQMIDQQRRQKIAKENAINKFIIMKKDKFRKEYREYRRLYDRFSYYERLA